MRRVPAAADRREREDPDGVCHREEALPLRTKTGVAATDRDVAMSVAAPTTVRHGARV